MNKHHNVSNQPYNILKASLLVIGVMMTVTGCGNSQKVEDEKNIKEIAETDVIETTSDDSTAKDSSTTNSVKPASDSIDNTQTQTQTTSHSNNVVSPDGYKGLKFNQIITPEVLQTHGLSRGQDVEDDNCYFVSDPKNFATNATTNHEPMVVYQIIDGRLKLISIEDSSIPFYTGVKEGDSVQQVMRQHQNSLDYHVSKYSLDNEYYHLIGNVNFSVAKDNVEGTFLKRDNLYLTEGADVPLQIKYVIVDGQDMGSRTIKASEWQSDTLQKLTGEVSAISIGLPEAIEREEGCS